MKNILPRNKELQDVPTEVLISELTNAHAYCRSLVYNELSQRVNSGKELFHFLREAISEKRNREEVFLVQLK